MNRYHLDIIVGGPVGILTNLIEVEADGFDYSTSGAYKFWKVVSEDDIGIKDREVIAMYPIDRTIIRKIEKDINKLSKHKSK
jgi:hypothetical protein